jgi:uncharacterized protein (TIGR03643 family)
MRLPTYGQYGAIFQDFLEKVGTTNNDVGNERSGDFMPRDEQIDLTESKRAPLRRGDIDRIVQMAWEDRTTFDAIEIQFGLSPGEVIKLMRRELRSQSFKLWRKRTSGRETKHLSKRSFLVGRFRCPNQRG